MFISSGGKVKQDIFSLEGDDDELRRKVVGELSVGIWESHPGKHINSAACRGRDATLVIVI